MADWAHLIGYISGSVLGRLLKHPRAADFNIVALVRSREKAMIIRSKFRVNAVVGTLDEHDKLTGLAERADIVFSVVRARTPQSADNSLIIVRGID